MAKIPTPRSYSAVLSDMVDVFLAKFGLKQLRVGSPVLSILEAAAMSDVRSSQDIFDLLASTNLDRATGTALDRIAADENMVRLAMAPSSGAVTVRDGRMTKISSRVYQGDAAPIAGSDYVLVTDAKAFPDPSQGAPAAKCKIYIGRGTANVEGPLTYTAKYDLGTHYRLELATGSHTSKFHNVGESVVLSQNGNRTISAGAIVQTAQNGSSNPVQFNTLYPATIPDGEESVENVIIVARQAGEAGNVPQNTISSFASAPFTGAEVLNPLPLSNGREAENDTDLRERIKATRQSRARGTALAIKNSVLGIVSPQENKRVASASVVSRQGGATTLYIDDGTGYEERSSGISLDALNDLALGGEQFFQLSSRAIAKASVKTSIKAPFALSSGAKLSVLVGGSLYEHAFLAAEFRAIGNASAYEVVASINANPDLQFVARTADGGTSVVLSAKQDVNEDIQVISPTEGANANAALLIPTGRADTLRLYKNDKLLFKDGQVAQIRSTPISLWSSFSGEQTLTAAVDGTPAVEYSFVDDDFSAANTGYTNVGKNTLDAWAAVINAKIPGITASVSSGALVLSSNAGRSARAKIAIIEGSLVTNGVFSVGTASGKNNDYTLDRNLGQIRLEAPLRAGDKLAAGSISTRAFVESAEIKSVSIQEAALLYFAVDGDAQVVRTGVSGSTKFDIIRTGSTYRFAADSAVFTSVALGDWLILWDSAPVFNDLKGQWRVTGRSNTYIDVECAGATAGSAINVPLSSLGMAFVRSNGAVQKVTVPAGTNYTASSLSKTIGEQLEGASCSVYRTKKVRVRTNTFDQHGSVALVAANSAAAMLGFAVSGSGNHESHLGSVESGISAVSVPSFSPFSVGALSTATQINTSNFPASYSVVGLSRGATGYSNKHGFVSGVSAANTTSLTLRNEALSNWSADDRFYAAAPLAIGPQDDLVVVTDSDIQSKRFAIPLWREIKAVDATYDSTNTFKDSTSQVQSLAKVFGTGYDFNDHAIHMHARVAVKHTSASGATPDIMFRYKRLGADGEQARVRYVYPSAPDKALSVVVRDLPDTAGMTDIDIVIPSGASKSISGLTNTSSLGYQYKKQTNNLYEVKIRTGFTAATATLTNNVVTVTVDLPTDVTDHNLQDNNIVYFVPSAAAASIGTGEKKITRISATSFSFPQTGANTTTPISSPGTFFVAPSGNVSFSALVPGDLVSFDASATCPVYLQNTTIKISSVETLSITAEATLSASLPVVSKPEWNMVSDVSKIKFFGLNQETCAATAVANSINALGDSCPITATVLKATDAAPVTGSSDSMAQLPSQWYQLRDGVNWVKNTTAPVNDSGDYQLEFKNTVDSGLSSVPSGWQNETARIVPVTMKALRNWLSVPAISGLFSTCKIEQSSHGSKLQLSTLTPGSGGSVQVQGGGANEVRAPVVGSAIKGGSYIACDVRASDATSMQAGQWVSIDNAQPQAKSGLLGAETTVEYVREYGVISLTSDSPKLRQYYSESTEVRFEKQGDFVAVIGITPNKAAEGDWLSVWGDEPSSANQGQFRVVRASQNVLWIENAAAVEESALCTLVYTKSSSLMIGDTVSFSTNDIVPRGKWIVDGVDDWQFSIRLAPDQTIPPIVAPKQLAEGLITVTEASPARFIKRIHSIVPSPRSSSSVSVKLDTDAGYERIAAGAGSIITVLNKLNFPTVASFGMDGYAYSVGLISEANRVVYGDPSDTSTYPGMAAAGSTINISGPILKRVNVSLSIRTRLGVPTTDVSDKVKASVASAINRSAVGQAVAISDVVKAASRVSGVQAVTILEPTYGAGNDIIPAQPYEKLLVLDVDQDVLVTFVGE